MPKISVLMPIYKTREEHLRQAIESVLAQTLTGFELLILDDCPEDDREQIVKSYADKRINYFKNEKNLGISETRNKLITLAKGEYLAVFDHDDICHPKRFEKEAKILDNHPEIGVVGCDYQKYPNGKIKRRPHENEDIECALMQGCAILHPCAMIRKSVLKGLKYEQAFSPAEDYALWCRLLGKTKFYNIPEVLFFYRDHENNTSKHQKQKMDNAGKKIQTFVRKEHPDIYKKACQNARFRIKVLLFGKIPLFQFTQKGQEIKGFLTHLKFLKFKSKMEIKG